jgi:hypothetical protein
MGVAKSLQAPAAKAARYCGLFAARINPCPFAKGTDVAQTPSLRLAVRHSNKQKPQIPQSGTVCATRLH